MHQRALFLPIIAILSIGYLVIAIIAIYKASANTVTIILPTTVFAIPSLLNLIAKKKNKLIIVVEHDPQGTIEFTKIMHFQSGRLVNCDNFQ